MRTKASQCGFRHGECRCAVIAGRSGRRQVPRPGASSTGGRRLRVPDHVAVISLRNLRGTREPHNSALVHVIWRIPQACGTLRYSFDAMAKRRFRRAGGTHMVQGTVRNPKVVTPPPRLSYRCSQVARQTGSGGVVCGAESYAKHRGPVFRAFSVHRQVRHICPASRV